MFSFLSSKVIKYLGIGAIGIAIVVLPYCQGKKVGRNECIQRGLEDTLQREEEYQKVREKREEEYEKIVDNLNNQSDSDKHKSDLLSKRPFNE